MTSGTPEDAAPDEAVAGFGFRAPRAAEAMTGAAVLSAADRLGLWDALSDQPATADDVADRLAIDGAGTAVLLRALTGLGVLTRDDAGRYRPTVAAAAYRRVADRWTGLESSVRRRPKRRLPDYAGVVDVLADGMSAASDSIGAAIGPARRVLDLGSGAAPHTRRLALTRPDLGVTLVDHAPVLERARRRVEHDGVGDRFTFLAGDLFSVELPPGQDVVLLAGVLHLYDDISCRVLLRRATATLGPGGRVAIVEPLPHESLDGPLDITLYAVGLYLRAPDGGVRPFSTYAAWLAEAGLVDVRRHDVSRRVSVVIARRG